MQAIHVNHTAPFFANPTNVGKKYAIADYDLLTTILSALKWREKNGTIKLYTDTDGYNFYLKNGLLGLWDMVDTKVLNSISENINYNMFWAGGKLFAMQAEKAPFVMLDTDFIVWENINQLLTGNKTVCVHFEEITPKIYPAKEHLKTAPAYKWYNYDWALLPANGALVYHGNQRLLDFYTSEAIRFMHNNQEPASENVTQMVFAEQRLLTMCARLLGVELTAILDHTKPFEQQGFQFTHIWGLKLLMANNTDYRKLMCSQLLNRIASDYPFMLTKLKNIGMFNEYLN